VGKPKLKIKEMGSRYLFIVAYVWLEKYFSRGDYRKPRQDALATSEKLPVQLQPEGVSTPK
jgi:dolichol-phosphate mannosyltransferase